MANIAAFAWASFVIELTPGPNMTYLAVLTLSRGQRAGLAAVAGVATGLAIIGAVAGLGAGAAISASPALYQTVRIAGIAYLIWLAYETWSQVPNNAAADIATNERMDLWRAYRRGLITNLLNPKAAAFYIAVLPVFVDPGTPPVGQMLTLATVYVAIATAVHLAIVMLAARARPLIVAGGNSALVRRGLALSLLAVAVWMAAVTQR